MRAPVHEWQPIKYVESSSDVCTLSGSRAGEWHRAVLRETTLRGRRRAVRTPRRRPRASSLGCQCSKCRDEWRRTIRIRRRSSPVSGKLAIQFATQRFSLFHLFTYFGGQAVACTEEHTQKQRKKNQHQPLITTYSILGVSKNVSTVFKVTTLLPVNVVKKLSVRTKAQKNRNFSDTWMVASAPRIRVNASNFYSIDCVSLEQISVHLLVFRRKNAKTSSPPLLIALFKTRASKVNPIFGIKIEWYVLEGKNNRCEKFQFDELYSECDLWVQLPRAREGVGRAAQNIVIESTF